MDEDAYQRLAARLASPAHRDRAMQPDALQGFFAALSMGPSAEVPADWLTIALGAEPGEDHDAELVTLLEAMRTETADAIEAGTLRVRALTTRTGRTDYAGWCRGFLEGVASSEVDWFAFADVEDLDELMFPIDVLGGALTAQERAGYKPAEWRTLVRDCEAALPENVARLASYWSIVRAPPTTFRRDAPKVGRNDPCPCGSGRKFKQCHGNG